MCFTELKSNLLEKNLYINKNLRNKILFISKIVTIKFIFIVLTMFFLINANLLRY